MASNTSMKMTTTPIEMAAGTDSATACCACGGRGNFDTAFTTISLGWGTVEEFVGVWLFCIAGAGVFAFWDGFGFGDPLSAAWDGGGGVTTGCGTTPGEGHKCNAVLGSVP